MRTELSPELQTPYYKVESAHSVHGLGFWALTQSCLVFSDRDLAQVHADERNRSRARALAGQLKRRVLLIEGSPSDLYKAWLTDTDGNIYPVGDPYLNPWAVADWCDRNGFAFEVCGLLDGVDPTEELAKWRAVR